MKSIIILFGALVGSACFFVTGFIYGTGGPEYQYAITFILGIACFYVAGRNTYSHGYAYGVFKKKDFVLGFLQGGLKEIPTDKLGRPAETADGRKIHYGQGEAVGNLQDASVPEPEKKLEKVPGPVNRVIEQSKSRLPKNDSGKNKSRRRRSK